MRKITGAIIALAIICLISGGFAFIINDGTIDDVNTNSIAKTNDIQKDANQISEKISNEDNKKDVGLNTVNNIITSSKNDANNIYGFYHWIKVPNTKYAWIGADLDYTDRYLVCMQCDKVFPLGQITKLVPEDYRYCNGIHLSSNLEYGNTNTYEDIIKMGDYEKFFGHGPMKMQKHTTYKSMKN